MAKKGWRNRGAWFVLAGIGLSACNGGRVDAPEEAALPTEEPLQKNREAWYHPAVGETWQWQLQGDLDTDYPVMLYDIDLFDTPASTIEQLHAVGKKVICYFSGGSYEAWRRDAGAFPSEDLGKSLDGWDGERWLDIRAEAVIEVMRKRLDLARDKGCDGVEPDNMDGYSTVTGFPLTAADQLAFNRTIAKAAHSRQLSVGLKNDLKQIPELLADFDFSVNEQCFEYDECDLLQSFIKAGKPVFNAEYARDYVDSSARRASLCADANNRRLSTLILPLKLDDSFRFACF